VIVEQQHHGVKLLLAFIVKLDTSVSAYKPLAQRLGLLLCLAWGVAVTALSVHALLNFAVS
jgi:hypothetical protein